MKTTETNLKMVTIMCRKSTDIHALEQDMKTLVRTWSVHPEQITINRIIELDHNEYTDFKENLLEDREWLKDQDGIVLIKEHGADNQSGIIVQTSGFWYARYSGLPMQEVDYKKCPKCGKLYTEHPAISRKDNKTEICSKCGTKEALEQAGFDTKQLKLIDDLHNTANQYNVEIHVIENEHEKIVIKPN